MSKRDVNVKAGRIDHPSWGSLIGKPFACDSAIWTVKGVYLTATRSGNREVWWILREQPHEHTRVGGNGE